MTDYGYEVLNASQKRPENSPTSKLIKAWTKGVPVEHEAKQQLFNVASMPFVGPHLAVMPDVHMGRGATIGSVIPTIGAIIPAAVGVDIGCGMAAFKITRDGKDLNARDLPDSLKNIRHNIERNVPVGFGQHKRAASVGILKNIIKSFDENIGNRYPEIGKKRKQSIPNIIGKQYGTLGGGNHFIELCLDENDSVWLILHSGSRGIGNMIGMHFINLAKQDMKQHFINIPDQDLAYVVEGTKHFRDYVKAVSWAQNYAMENRRRMLVLCFAVLDKHLKGLDLDFTTKAINCHHNYIEQENHFGKNLWITRKGAIRARECDYGIIPGSMGAKSYIVKGKGNLDSFMSCSHGAGRVMSRSKAKKLFNVEDHKLATEGVECRKDAGVIDETPGAYKNIDHVMDAQKDLVEIVHTLRQVLCIKG